MTVKHAFFIILSVIACLPAHASSYTVVYKFKGMPTDGANPHSGLSGDGNGYGTTEFGGVYGQGAVYKITSTGQETLLHSFQANEIDGTAPIAGVVQAKNGYLYGTTSAGGRFGYGTVYKITPAGRETVIHSFTGFPSDGASPYAGMIQASDGNLYGTTQGGGAYGGGTVYKITPTGQESIFYSFMGGTDGDDPFAGVIQATDGNFYGTTYSGGVYNMAHGGYGTVYTITPTGQETVLHSFSGTPNDGYASTSGLIQATDGNFYGTTEKGGALNFGTVYTITPTGQETVLFSFGGANGAEPDASLIQGQDGNFYGTTTSGGGYSRGVVFQVTPTGQETVLHSFNPNAGDGGGSDAPLVQDKTGDFYGTCSGGGQYNFGTIFRLIL